ncbi:MAG: energy transducer TonB [Flavobacteriales bacterium]|nr:energy transducer TonB [Flavobacteriales bacterium]
MRHKKSENSNLEKKRKGFLITGLMFASCFSLIFLEWASFKAMDHQADLSYYEDFVEQEIVPVYFPKPKTKVVKPRTSNTLLEVIEDDLGDEDEITFEDIPLDEEEIDDFDLDIEVFDEDKLFIIVEQKPKFPGGDKAMMEFLGKNLNYPPLAVDARREGTVYVQFIVAKDGSISNVTLSSSNGVTRKVGGGCDEEAIRVVKKMPKWKPGKQRGKAVNVQFTLPVSFKLK